MTAAHETPLLTEPPTIPQTPVGAATLRAGDSVERALRVPPHVVYDALADHYDDRYDTPECHAENTTVAALVQRYTARHSSRRVLDVGAGTGLAIDLGITDYPRGYTAVEPSAAMLDRLRAKHPEARTIHAPAAGIPKDAEFDIALALFGSASYCTPREIRYLDRLIRRNEATGVLMTYSEGYWPDYYPAEPQPAPLARRALRRLPSADLVATVSGRYDLWVIE